VGTFCLQFPDYCRFCSAFVRSRAKIGNAKSPAIAGLLLVGARGFEPPTPSFPVKDADSDIANYINSLACLTNMFSGFFSGLLNLLEPGSRLLVEDVGIFQRGLKISVI
jgi:hypothetical protein